MNNFVDRNIHNVLSIKSSPGQSQRFQAIPHEPHQSRQNSANPTVSNFSANLNNQKPEQAGVNVVKIRIKRGFQKNKINKRKYIFKNLLSLS